jgi:outer membrane protein assembly factor BamD
MAKKNKLLIFSLILTIGLVSACSSDDEKPETNAEGVSEGTIQDNATELFQQARQNMKAGNYNKAIEIFQEVERLYPFSDLAPKSRVMSAYSNYKNEEYEKAIGIIDNFISLNPGNDDIEFMYYLKALSYYDRIKDIRRDQDITRRAKQSLQEIIRRFPSTKYAKDSKYKLDLIRDHLAGKEMEIGRFYLKQENYIASLNRFKEVVNNYDDTNQIEEALYRVTEANIALGLMEEANKYAAILGHNYPDSNWYKKAYNLVQNPGQQSIDDSFVSDIFGGGFFGFGSSGGDNSSDDIVFSEQEDGSRDIEKVFEEEIDD